MQTEKQFDDFLNIRRIEPPSAGFAERIITGAKERKANVLFGAVDAINDFILSFLLPRKPAYAVAFLLIIGILIGTSLPVQTGEETMATVNYEEVL